MNLWLLLPLLLPMLAGLLLLTKPFAEGKIRRLTVQIGLILTLVSLFPAFLTSGRDLTLFTLSDNVENCAACGRHRHVLLCADGVRLGGGGVLLL